MAEETVSRREHEEFARRIDEENTRQNHRLSALEESIGEIHTLSASVEKLAVNMESMLKEMDKQGQRLSVLEGRDGEKWRTIVSYLITAALGIILGAIFRSIGF